MNYKIIAKYIKNLHFDIFKPEDFLSLSKNTTFLLPLESASKPRAPVPANISKQFLFSRSFISQLKRVSLVLLSVGLNALLSLKEILVPLNLPAIILDVACLLGISTILCPFKPLVAKLTSGFFLYAKL